MSAAPIQNVDFEARAAAAEESQRRKLARQRFLPFCRYTMNSWEDNWHLETMGEALERVLWGSCKRLILVLPPRHAKSEMASVRLPAMYLGKYPQKQIIHASYSIDLSRTFSVAARDIIKSGTFQKLWPTTLSGEGSTEWKIEGKENHRPNFIAAGVGGGISGQGADLLIIDDPIKNWEEAESVVMREKIWTWYTSTARTRLQPRGAIIIIMTRWHEDDLVGRLLALAKADPTADQWEVLELPAVNTEPEEVQPALPRYKALWEKRYDFAWMMGTKATVGPKVWNGLYQGRPRPAEGNVIKRKWFKFYLRPTDQDPHDSRYPVHAFLPLTFEEQLQSWDMAFKDTQASAFVVGQVWGRVKADKFLLDQVRDRMSFTVSKQGVLNLRLKWPEAHQILIEDKANGPAIIDALRHEVSAIIPIEPTGSKEARLEAASSDFASGNIYVPHPSIAPWVLDYIEELCAAPNGVFWDQCDASSQAINRMRSQGGGFYAFLQQKHETFEAAKLQARREEATERLIQDGVAVPTPDMVERKVEAMWGRAS